jgi:hypothetical protein
VLSWADQIPLVPLVILSSFTAFRSVRVSGEPAYWLNPHPAVSFFEEFAVFVLTHSTSLVPKNQRSFRKLVGSSECFPGQYRLGERWRDFSRHMRRTASLEFSPLQHVSIPVKRFRRWFRSALPAVTGHWPTLGTSRVYHRTLFAP